MNLKEIAGERLKAARIAAGFRSCRAFANSAGITYERLSLYERGKRHIDPAIAIEVGKRLNVSPGYLLGVEEERGLAPCEARLLTKFRHASPATREKIEAIVNLLAQDAEREESSLESAN